MRKCDTCDRFVNCPKADEFLMQNNPGECEDWLPFNLSRLLKVLRKVVV